MVPAVCTDLNKVLAGACKCDPDAATNECAAGKACLTPEIGGSAISKNTCVDVVPAGAVASGNDGKYCVATDVNPERATIVEGAGTCAADGTFTADITDCGSGTVLE